MWSKFDCVESTLPILCSQRVVTNNAAVLRVIGPLPLRRYGLQNVGNCQSSCRTSLRRTRKVAESIAPLGNYFAFYVAVFAIINNSIGNLHWCILWSLKSVTGVKFKVHNKTSNSACEYMCMYAHMYVRIRVFISS